MQQVGLNLGEQIPGCWQGGGVRGGSGIVCRQYSGEVSLESIGKGWRAQRIVGLRASVRHTGSICYAPGAVMSNNFRTPSVYLTVTVFGAARRLFWTVKGSL